MNVSVVVPTQPDDPERMRLWAWCRQQYPQAWEIVEAPSDRIPWSKACVTPAVQHATGGVVVIADCDLLIGGAALVDGITALLAGAPWVVPHGEVFRLSRAATGRMLRRDVVPVPHPVGGRHHKGPAGGGFVICTRAAYLAVGGFDPRFTDWGGEDISLARALDTLVGRHVRLGAHVWHLWHRPMQRYEDRRASPANELLAARYLEAHGHPDRMWSLVQEHACLSAS